MTTLQNNFSPETLIMLVGFLGLLIGGAIGYGLGVFQMRRAAARIMLENTATSVFLARKIKSGAPTLWKRLVREAPGIRALAGALVLALILAGCSGPVEPGGGPREDGRYLDLNMGASHLNPAPGWTVVDFCGDPVTTGAGSAAAELVPGSDCAGPLSIWGGMAFQVWLEEWQDGRRVYRIGPIESVPVYAGDGSGRILRFEADLIEREPGGHAAGCPLYRPADQGPPPPGQNPWIEQEWPPGWWDVDDPIGAIQDTPPDTAQACTCTCPVHGKKKKGGKS